MSRRRLRKNDLLRTYDALDAHAQYQRESAETETGRKADVLRHRGHDVGEVGNEEAAHTLFLEAAALFSPDDRSAAASSTHYDLAESYRRLTTGVPEENLRESIRLLELCVASPARRRDPLRLALAFDGLGKSERLLAAEVGDNGGKELLVSSTRHLVEACRIVGELGLVGLQPSAEYHNNLGNLLRQRGKVDHAIQAFEECLRIQREIDDLAAGDAAEMIPRLPWNGSCRSNALLNLASVLTHRDRPGDAERALDHATAVFGLGEPDKADRARILAASILLDRRASGDLDRAQVLLAPVDLRRLEDDALIEFACLQERLGQRDLALLSLQHGIDQGFRQRRDAAADHVADHAANRIQRFARVQAEILTDRGDALGAFLTLEEASGLRYFDSVTSLARDTLDPVARRLEEHRIECSVTARSVEDFAGRLARVDSDVARHLLRDQAAYVEGHIDASGRDKGRLGRQLADAFRRAADAPSPQATLREFVEVTVREDARLGRLVEERSPSMHRSDQPFMQAITRERLAEVLAEHPGTVLMRVAGMGDFLVTTAWLEAGEVVARTLQLKGPDNLLGALLGTDGAHRAKVRLSDVLPSLDVRAALPPGRHPHLVVLPSLGAAWVPWAVAGPPDDQLLDRFDAITYLPALTPYLTHQKPGPPRTGTLVVAPGRFPHESPTRFHYIALENRIGEEVRLADEDATPGRVLEHTPAADVVTFYAHGRPWFEGGAIVLADGDLAADDLNARWSGCERVELWACQTGVNRPHDPLTPLVDEGFGLDVSFHHQGVRSTIGSLWSVPDYVTAQIVRHYRNGLADGVPSPRALADAQRWWRDQGAQVLRDWLGGTSRDELATRLGDLLGDAADAILGPVDGDSTPSAAEIERVVAHLLSPEAWSGYRFVGVCERRPTEPWVAPPDLTEADEAVVERLLAAHPEQAQSIDEMMERWLTEARKLDADQYPTVEQAVRVAQRYAERPFSSHRHDVIRGLAWLHEVLRRPDLSTKDRARLELETAWQWFELARGELVHERARVLFPVDPVLSTRCRLLLANKAGPEAAVLTTWLDVLDNDEIDGTARTALVLNRWAGLWANVETLPSDDVPGLRARAAAVELLLFNDSVDPDLLNEIMRQANISPREECLCMAATFHALIATVAARNGILVWSPSSTLLRHRDLTRLVEAQQALLGERGPTGLRRASEAVNEAINLSEMDYWGVPSDDRRTFWCSSGSPGLAWASVVGSYLAGKHVQGPNDAHAVHAIASIHMGGDLKLGPMNGWARLAGKQEEAGVRGPWWITWLRRAHIEQLEDAARVPDLRQGSSSAPHPADPFQLDSDALLAAGLVSPDALTAWIVANGLESWGGSLAKARTAAFAVERRLLEADEAMMESGPDLLKAMRAHAPKGVHEDVDMRRVWDRMLDLLDPMIRMNSAEAWVRDLPAGIVVLGVLVHPMGQLLLAAAWKHGDKVEQRTHMSPTPTGRLAAFRMAELVGPREEDQGDLPNDGRRATIWRDLVESLAPALDTVLGDSLGKTSLVVLAPGPLRGVPWGGLELRGAPLNAHFAGVCSLPQLGFERTLAYLPPQRPDKRPFTMCLAGPLQDPSDNAFGMAVVRSLRALHGVDVVAEPQRVVGTHLPEIDLLEMHAANIEVLRMYGNRGGFTVNPSTESLELSGGRSLSAQNLVNTLLPRCRWVELWGSTGAAGEARAIRDGDRDAMPHLVRCFLTCGAAGVLDVAWPVPDLVQALVCEVFGHITQPQSKGGPHALSEALAYVEGVLRSWQRDADAYFDLRAALGALDGARARLLGASDAAWPQGMVRFASVHVGTRDSRAFVDEMCKTVHLRAFRWWGV
jgi:tetratricopeptide (TPR) repeat protein